MTIVLYGNVLIQIHVIVHRNKKEERRVEEQDVFPYYVIYHEKDHLEIMISLE